MTAWQKTAIVGLLMFAAALGVSFYLMAPPRPAAALDPSPQIGPRLRSLRSLNLPVRAFLAAYLPPGGAAPEILIARNASEPLPLASVSKLLTAWVAREHYDLNQLVTITPEDLVEPVDPSLFSPGETFTIKSLLNSLLVESSNYSAAALARLMGRDNFLEAMNSQARQLELASAAFFNPSGLDREDSGLPVNHASSYDLLRLARAIQVEHPEILAATAQTDLSLFDAAGNFHHALRPTNQLLGGERWPAKIIGGKTGQTDLAGKNLLLVLEDKQSGGHLVTVVLGAQDHFAATAALLDWLYASYDFSL